MDHTFTILVSGSVNFRNCRQSETFCTHFLLYLLAQDGIIRFTTLKYGLIACSYMVFSFRKQHEVSVIRQFSGLCRNALRVHCCLQLVRRRCSVVHVFQQFQFRIGRLQQMLLKKLTKLNSNKHLFSIAAAFRWIAGRRPNKKCPGWIDAMHKLLSLTTIGRCWAAKPCSMGQDMVDCLFIRSGKKLSKNK